LEQRQERDPQIKTQKKTGINVRPQTLVFGMYNHKIVRKIKTKHAKNFKEFVKFSTYFVLILFTHW
jgi:hypothetical protein